MPKSVFLCHSSTDKAFIRQLAQDLKDAEIDVWLDEWSLRVGDSLNSKIQEAINCSGYLIIVISSSSVNSKWVERELDLALTLELEKKSVFVLPLLLEPVDLPPFLKDKLYADFTGDYDVGLASLLRTLNPYIELQAVQPKINYKQKIYLFGSSENLVTLRKMERLLLKRGFSRSYLADGNRPGPGFYRQFYIDYDSHPEYYCVNELGFHPKVSKATVDEIIKIIKEDLNITFDIVRKNEDIPLNRDIDILFDRPLTSDTSTRSA